MRDENSMDEGLELRPHITPPRPQEIPPPLAPNDPPTRPTPLGATPNWAFLPPEAIGAPTGPRPDDRQERASLDVPICPRRPVDDNGLFEDPKDPTVHYYLPRYRLRRAGEREVIGFLRRDGAWRLELELEPFVPSSLGDVGAAGPIDHTVAVILHHRVDDGQFDAPFVVTDTAEGTKRAVLAFADISERDAVWWALTDQQRQARLIVRRLVNVAVPARPIIFLPAAVGLPPADPKPASANPPGPPTVVRRRIPIPRPQGDELRPLQAAGAGRQITPRPQLYVKVEASVEHDERKAFLFPPELYPYVYSAIKGVTGEVTFRLVYLPFNGRQHRYYRDPMDRRVMHFLPDAFKLARQPDPPHKPTLLLRFAPGAQALEDVRVELEYYAVPHVDPERLRDAARELPALLADDPLPAGASFAFRTISPPREQLKLVVGLPGGQSDVRDEAQVELSTVVRDSLDLSLDEFQTLWESMFSTASVFFQGTIDVALSDGTERIPFVGRIDDLEGPVVDVSERLLPGGTAEVTIRNSCESPVTLRDLEASVTGPGGPVACTIEGTDPAALKLAAGESAALQLVPVTALESVAAPVVRVGATDVEPDKDAVYQAILDPSATLVQLTRRIRVRAKHLFDAASPQDPLIAILVEFRGSPTTTELTPSAPDGDGIVFMPVSDFVLKSVTSGDAVNAGYRYRTTRVHGASGQHVSDWIAATTDVLYLLATPAVAATAQPDPPSPSEPAPPT